jgi:hypothetical protein
MAALELLAGAARAWVVAGRRGRLVGWLSQIADGFSRRSAAGKPVRMDVARGGGDQVNEGLMSCNGIIVGVDQFLQPVLTALYPSDDSPPLVPDDVKEEIAPAPPLSR